MTEAFLGDVLKRASTLVTAAVFAPVSPEGRARLLVHTIGALYAIAYAHGARDAVESQQQRLRELMGT